MIREATKNDINRIAHLGRDFVETAWEGIAAYSVMDTVEWLEEFLKLPSSILYVAEVDREVVGMIAGHAHSVFFDKTHLNAQELFWWVTPEHRKSSVGIKLLKRFEDWARARGAKTIQMGTVAAIEPEKLASVYKRMGYANSENYYIKVL